MDVFSIAAQLLLGWLLADLISGLVHWLEDRVFWVGMPLLSKAVVEPNRLHHIDAQAFLRQSLLSRNSTTWPVVLAIALPWLAVAGFSWIWLGAMAGGLVVTEVHVRTHRPVGASWYSALQEIGIVQSRGHHVGHHAPPMDRRYCILTNWINPILDRAAVWRRLESSLEAIGLTPNRGKA